MVFPKIMVWIVVGACTAMAMEAWAALLHRVVWHTLLWPLHRTHHQERGDIDAAGTQHTPWQLNDMLSCTHAPVAIGLILYGCRGPIGAAREICFGVGLGMSLFGVCYIVIHDGLAHGRLPVRLLAQWRYLRLVRNAHGLHHRTGGPPFGLFSGPWFLARRQRSRQGRQLAAAKRQSLVPRD